MSYSKDILRENKRRLSLFEQEYDPIKGIGSKIPRYEWNGYWLPVTMKDDSIWSVIAKADIPFELKEKALNMEIRIKHDFEYWAATTIKITPRVPNEDGEKVLFVLNEPQRKFIAELEKDRVAGIPIRFIVVKGRQWGGSTLTQFYSMWIQNVLRKRWNSCIIADVEAQSRRIKNMYTSAAKDYPKWAGTLTLAPFEGDSKNRVVEETKSVLSIGSMQNPDTIRSEAVKSAHLSEIAYWKKTASKTPEDVIQTITGSMPLIPDTLLVMESTANGVGNYFHNVYLDAKTKESSYRAFFVSWQEFGDNIAKMDETEYEDFYNGLSEYEIFLWNNGATLEGIKWYRNKLSEMSGNTWRMRSEFPTTDIEAFQSTGNRVFPFEYVDNNRVYNEPAIWTGDYHGDANIGEEALNNISWINNPKGNSFMWAKPEIGYKNRYLVIVDIGGTTDLADWSVIRVFDRKYITEGGRLEAVFTCRLHQDVDIVAWKAARIAKAYDNALLVIEKNSLNRKKDAGENYLATLEEIAEIYDNVFKRQGREDEEQEGVEVKYGFHTNRQTKPMIVKQFKAALREGTIMERDRRVLDEADIYEEKEDGSYGAVEGKNTHDDLLMTTMIGNHISTYVMEPCKEIDLEKKPRRKNKVLMAKF